MLPQLFRYQPRAALDGGAQALTTDADYWADGTVTLAPTTGNYTVTSNLSNSTEGDTSNGVSGSADIVTVLRAEHVAGAPARVTLTITYTGSMAVTCRGWNGSSWDTLTDISGVAWSAHGVSASEKKDLVFASGSTTYTYMSFTCDAGSGTTTVTDMRVYNDFVPSLTASLHTNLQANRDVYDETTCTTLLALGAYTDGAVLKGWKDLVSGKIFSDATGAKYKRTCTSLSRTRPAVQFCDDPTSPTAYYKLDRANHFTAALFDTSLTCYIVAAKPAARTNEGQLFGTSASLQWQMWATDDRIKANAFSLVAPITQQTDDAYQGVYSSSWNGSILTSGYNGRITGTRFGTALGIGTENARIGNYDGTSTYAWNGWIYTILLYSVAHTRSQQATIVSELMNFYGDSATATVLCVGNSITAGFLGYNNPYPSQLSSYMTSPYIVENRGTAGWLTYQVADDLIGGTFQNKGNGTYMYQKTLGGTPTRTSIDTTTTPFSNGAEAGNIAYMIDGGQKGYGAVVDTGNDTDTLPLVTPGFPAAPAAGDKVQVWAAGLQSNYCIAIPWEMTNDLKTNGATEGPTAVSSVKANCGIYQRFIALCNSLRGAGFKVIVPTMLPRNDAGLPADFQTDWGILNGWIRNDYASYGDVLGDVNTLVQFENVAAITTYSTHWLDNVHPNNTGGGVLAQYFAGLIEGIIP